MKSRWMSTLIFLLATLIGCSSNQQVAGGSTDDFPNSRSALSKVIAASLQSSRSWTQVSMLPDSLPDTILQLLPGADTLLATAQDSAVVAKRAARSLAKMMVDFDTLRWVFTDSASGFVTRYHYKEDMYSWQADTAMAYYGPAVRDSIRDNETLLTLRGRVNYKPANYSIFQFFDTDTNTFLDSSLFEYATENPGYTNIFRTTGTSGNDNNFTDLTKLKIASIGFFDVSGYDTLQLYMLSDADHDGSVHNSLIPVNDVNFRMVLRNRVPGETYSDQRMIARMKATDSGRIELLRYWSKARFSDGRDQTFWVNGPRTDSIYLPGDTATATMVTNGGTDFDTIRSAFKLSTSTDMYDWNSYRMHSYTTELFSQRDTITRFVFACQLAPGLSIHDSLLSINGDFNATVSWMDGTTAVIKGQIIHGTVVGTYTGTDKHPRKLTWNIDTGLTLE